MPCPLQVLWRTPFHIYAEVSREWVPQDSIGIFPPSFSFLYSTTYSYPIERVSDWNDGGTANPCTQIRVNRTRFTWFLYTKESAAQLPPNGQQVYTNWWWWRWVHKSCYLWHRYLLIHFVSHSFFTISFDGPLDTLSGIALRYMIILIFMEDCDSRNATNVRQIWCDHEWPQKSESPSR